MNSISNGKVMANTLFKPLYVQSAAGEAGSAIGAAFHIWHALKAGSGVTGNAKPTFVRDHACWGSQFSAGDIAAFEQTLDRHPGES